MLSYYVIKPRSDEDLYVGWSGVVDNLVWVGTRAGALASGVAAERLDRADATGTSVLPDPDLPAEPDATHALPGAWNDRGLLVMNAETVRGARWLPRERLAEYARHLWADRVVEAEACTEPLPDEDEEEEASRFLR